MKRHLNGISDIRDESDKDGMRIVLELKRGEIPDVTINQLYKYTDLQVTFGCNMLALDKGMPRTMNIKQMIVAWIDHRIEVIRRRTRFELDQSRSESPYLRRLSQSARSSRCVVRLIRASENRDAAKTELMAHYALY